MTASSSPRSWPLPRNAAGQQAQHCTKAGVTNVSNLSPSEGQTSDTFSSLTLAHK